MSQSNHPPVLTSLAIIRDRPEMTARSTIRAVGLFTVTRCGDREARFHVHHAGFDRSASRAEIIDGICARIAPGSQLLARVPRVPRGCVEQALAAGEPLAPADIQLIQRQLPGIDLVPVQIAERQLASAADEIGIACAGRSAPIWERARRAPEAAQLLWLLYLQSFCPPREWTDLSAAWRAWSLIEQARPLGF